MMSFQDELKNGSLVLVEEDHTPGLFLLQDDGFSWKCQCGSTGKGSATSSVIDEWAKHLAKVIQESPIQSISVKVGILNRNSRC